MPDRPAEQSLSNMDSRYPRADSLQSRHCCSVQIQRLQGKEFPEARWRTPNCAVPTGTGSHPSSEHKERAGEHRPAEGWAPSAGRTSC